MSALQLNMRFAGQPRLLCTQFRWGIVAGTVLSFCFAAGGCRAPATSNARSVHILQTPVSATGGPDAVQAISGKVEGAGPEQAVVVYARSGVWWVQPFANEPFTRIRPDGSWATTTHLGSEYAALLVEKGYRPAAKLSALPASENGVLAIAIQEGAIAPPSTSHLVHFSGYEWAVRSTESDHGGDTYSYSSDNAWVDGKGYLHLRMRQDNSKWTCAEVVLTRSLGYGTYRFVVQDSSRLSVTAVLDLFTWDDTSSEQANRELDIELSRWGEPANANAQFVIQPFFLPKNTFRFTTPAGLITHQVRWLPHSAAFVSTRGGGSIVAQHTFTEHVPTAGQQAVRIVLYDFHHTDRSSAKPVEVVLQSFTHQP